MSPHFTLILPAYNGGDYLRQCVDSVRAQTHSEWELAVLDDAGTDGSREWLEGLNEPRIRIYPAPRRLGIEANWARALDVPAADLMTFVGQDDLLDPSYLQVMADLIREHPTASLYHAHHRIIDAAGRLIRLCSPRPPRETAAEWLTGALQPGRFVHATGYVFRGADYRAVGGIPLYETLIFSDYALWTLLAQKGGVATAETECFSLRRHRKSASAEVDGLSHARALGRFLDFLNDRAAADPQLAEVVARCAPEFALKHARHAYRQELDRANLRNRRVKPEVLAAAQAALRRVAPDRLPEILQEPHVARRIRINAHPVKRLAYALRRRVRPEH